MTAFRYRTVLATVLCCLSVMVAGQTDLQKLLTAHPEEQYLTAHEKISEYALVLSFYEANGYALAWTDNMNVSVLLGIIQRSTDEGLKPDQYHYSYLKTNYSRFFRSSIEQAQWDILLTDAFLHYNAHLLNGKTDPSVLYPSEWVPEKENKDLVRMLQTALTENSLVRQVASLYPQHDGYYQLKKLLQYYRALQHKSPWPIIEQGEVIEPGMTDNRIPLIRKRLAATDTSINYGVTESALYDSLLSIHIKKFQMQYGLTADGIIGRQTIEALNYTLQYHIDKIIINMERYRWLPQRFTYQYLVVNIPAFQVSVHFNDSLVMEMKAIVGREDRKTPVITSDIHYLIINPTWTVPPTILREDVLPAVRRSIKYLERNNLLVINKEGEEVNPYGLPWWRYTETNFPYQIRQVPGPNNSLGLIKFHLTNNFKIFLHDTNHRHLFSQPNRALSSGCVRLEFPFQLAGYLLRETTWTHEKIDAAIDTGKTTTILLPKPVPVHFTYFTTYSINDVLQIRKDVYGWDEALLTSLVSAPLY